ncbi:MAG: hypothetical protein HN742_02450 [Lentisphaerae bacterium]|jgi:hypothetical protein|nr:hypothetical protein [Lentisphaerota bacterium]MBT4822959.1 hypothetical protein [Lentisphaerota bacterium]MBT5605315.1 hypothetical protein [Lentisphaerota bacterium]MBT7057535.1 hypothetical protein [Lentisphaerota bacterium]MBT7840699.1 hypothetical protein [Lentisphaerota bacterium]
MNAASLVAVASVVSALTGVVSAQAAVGQSLRVVDTFTEGDRTVEWRPIEGDWTLDAGACLQQTPGDGGYRYTVTDLPFEPVLLSVRAVPGAENALGFRSFGVVLRYQDANNWAVVRWGSYGGVSVLELCDGSKHITKIDRMIPELNVAHRVAVGWTGQHLLFFLDDRYAGAASLLGTSGRRCVGLFTESQCRFDGFQVDGDAAAWSAFRARVVTAEADRHAAIMEARQRVTVLPDGLFEDAFDGEDGGMWEALKGSWRRRDGRLELTSGEWGRFIALAPVVLLNGEISGSAVPLAKSVHGHALFGVMAKWVDAANWVAVRCGQYGNTAAFIVADGQRQIVTLGTYAPKLGDLCVFRVGITGDRLHVSCDGQKLKEVTVPFADVAGRPGFYTEASTAFDHIRIQGALPLPRVEEEPLAGRPDVSMEFSLARFGARGGRAASMDPKGVLHLFIRNQGTGPAELARTLVAGRDAEIADETVAWVRQRPHRILPGELGEVAVGLSRLPLPQVLALGQRPPATVELPIALIYRGDVQLDTVVSLAPQTGGIRINHVAFSESLGRASVYVDRLPGSGGARSCRLSRLEVNGRDVTPTCRWGSDEIVDDAVPIEVDLGRRLRVGEPVVISVATSEGHRAARSVRAFPADFPIQVTLLGKQTRPDAVADIARHHATCIGLCGADLSHLKEAKRLGLKAFHYGRGGLAELRRFDRPEFPAIAGFWLDEMDKLPVRETVPRIQEAEAAYRGQGRFIPPQMINLCQPRVPGARLYYELADIACSAYGFHGASIGREFGRLSALEEREYRLAGRPFMPYMRDAELGIVVDLERKRLLGRPPKHRRCLDPREERWMTYACVIQGAKGIMHWNYGAGIRKPPSWFSKEQTILRAAMGGALGHDPHGYRLPKRATGELQAVWDEIGRINLELRAVGRLIADSDVSRRARVVSAQPEHTADGAPAVETAALISGMDTIVLIVLNQMIDNNWTGDADRGIESYPPVDATVAVDLPPWIKAPELFRVTHAGVTAVTPKREPGRLLLDFSGLAVSDIVVITERAKLAETVKQTLVALTAAAHAQPD